MKINSEDTDKWMRPFHKNQIRYAQNYHPTSGQFPQHILTRVEIYGSRGQYSLKTGNSAHYVANL